MSLADQKILIQTSPPGRAGNFGGHATPEAAASGYQQTAPSGRKGKLYKVFIHRNLGIFAVASDAAKPGSSEANSKKNKSGQPPEFNPRCDSANSVNSAPTYASRRLNCSIGVSAGRRRLKIQNSTRGVILKIL